MTEQGIEIRVLPSLNEIDAVEWDTCACPEASNGAHPNDPFTTYRFLKALEDSNSVGNGTGWHPQYLQAKLNGHTIGVAPMYAKSHSQGEYIFDHNWAHAYENAGGGAITRNYKLLCHTLLLLGGDSLTHPDFADVGLRALLQGAVQLANNNGLSSLHATFCTKAERDAGVAMGLMARTTQQFHWLNDNYSNFDEFLDSLSSRKRKNIRKERAKAHSFGGTIQTFTGSDISPKHWDAFWCFYQDTGARKWGTPYLTRRFFEVAHDTLREDIALVLAEREGHFVAGALNFIGAGTLFGRYWGCIEHHPCLHFELCYYQAIDMAIARGMDRVEAGAQGEHKLARGYLPTQTHSLHWVGDPGFSDAIARYLEAERGAVEEEIEILTEYGPFKQVQIEEQE